jgi:hypothetical protein
MKEASWTYDHMLAQWLDSCDQDSRHNKPAPQQAGPAALSCEDSSSGRKGYGRGQ